MAALEKLPTYDRIRTSIFKQTKGNDEIFHQIDVGNMELETRHQLLDSLFKAIDQHNEPFCINSRKGLIGTNTNYFLVFSFCSIVNRIKYK